MSINCTCIAVMGDRNIKGNKTSKTPAYIINGKSDSMCCTGNWNKIEGYLLQDKATLTTEWFEPKKLREVLKRGAINIDNIKLAHNNKLVFTDIEDSAYKNATKLQNEGYRVTKRLIKDLRAVYCCTSPDNSTMVVILPDYLNSSFDGEISEDTMISNYGILDWIVVEFPGTVKVVGGRNLTCANWLFSYWNVGTLDLRGLDTSHTISMMNTFCNTKCGKILFGGKCTLNNLVKGKRMFMSAAIEQIDMSDIVFKNYVELTSMFQATKSNKVILPKFLNTFNIDEITKNKCWFFNINRIKDLVTDNDDIKRVWVSNTRKW